MTGLILFGVLLFSLVAFLFWPNKVITYRCAKCHAQLSGVCSAFVFGGMDFCQMCGEKIKTQLLCVKIGDAIHVEIETEEINDKIEFTLDCLYDNTTEITCPKCRKTFAGMFCPHCNYGRHERSEEDELTEEQLNEMFELIRLKGVARTAKG